MIPNRYLLAALGVSVLVAGGASAYALRARDSAMRAWEIAARVPTLEQSITELEVVNRNQLTESLRLVAENSSLQTIAARVPVLEQSIAGLEVVNGNQVTENVRLLAENSGLAVENRRVRGYNETFRRMLSKNASIADGDSDLDIALKLTRHLYEATLFSGPSVETDNESLRYVLTIEQETSNLCSSLSTTLDWALGLFGITARSVSMAGPDFFKDGKADTHTLVEAMIDGEVIAFDPTFNTTYACGAASELIDVRSMAECVKVSTLRPNYISTPRPGRSLSEYYISLDELLYAIQATGGSDQFYQYEYPAPGWASKAGAASATDAQSSEPRRKPG